MTEKFKDSKRQRHRRYLRGKSMEISKIWSGMDDENAQIQTDVLGSYTGTPKNADENPTQDADDL